MPDVLSTLADEYIHFEIAGKIISVPYVISKEGRYRYSIGDDCLGGTTSRFSNYAGKGTPKQIREVLIKIAQKKHFDLETAKPREVIAFMIQEGIGIDCSGFVYNVANKYFKKTKNKNLDTCILRYSGLIGRIERFLLQKNRVRRSSAATLTSDINTTTIEKVIDMQQGDMIRLTHSDWKGKHIAIIIDINDQYITYAMSSTYTKIQGTRFGKIKIRDKQKGLAFQEWLEVTKEGANYGKDAFDPKRGDAVKRLKFIAKL